jgi:hypothetical protein
VRKGDRKTSCVHGHSLALPENRNSAGSCKECARARGRSYQKRHRAQANTNMRRWTENNPVKSSWKSYRQNAKSRGLVFDLEFAAFESLVTTECHYCGILSTRINGVDRIDNGVGYITGNVVPCCVWCNYSKRERSLEDFLEWALRLADFSRKKVLL